MKFICCTAVIIMVSQSFAARSGSISYQYFKSVTSKCQIQQFGIAAIACLFLGSPRVLPGDSGK